MNTPIQTKPGEIVTSKKPALNVRNIGSVGGNIHRVLQNATGVKAPSPNATPTVIGHQFDERSMSITLGASLMKYTKHAQPESHGSITRPVSWGQLKLAVIELLFANYYFQYTADLVCVVVYVGAAPGIHLGALLRMYPDFEFHLYDGRDLDEEIASYPNVVNNCGGDRLFTDEDAKGWSEWLQESPQHRLYFISDIRSLTYEAKQQNPTREVVINNETIVREDMQLQKRWLEIISPTEALIKLRIPYYEPEIFGENKVYRYLDGTIYPQPFVGEKSSEVRLVPRKNAQGKYLEIDYDLEVFEQAIFYHNIVIRPRRYINPVTNSDRAFYPLAGVENEWDSVVLTIVIRDYLLKHSQPADLKSIIGLMTYLLEVIKSSKDLGLNDIRQRYQSGNKVFRQYSTKRH